MLNGWPPLRGKYLRRLKPALTPTFFSPMLREKKCSQKHLLLKCQRKHPYSPYLSPHPQPHHLASAPSCKLLGRCLFLGAVLADEQQQLRQSGDNIPRQSRRSVLLEKCRLSKQHPLLAVPTSRHWITGTRPAPQACSRSGGSGG